MRASLVIAAHTEGQALSRTLDSCIETTFGLDCEIVVVDDASDDGSVAAAEHRFPEIRVVRHEARLGTSPAKDAGARQARGEVLVFLDGHTRPEDGAVARLVEDVEHLRGEAIVTPAVAALDVDRWRNTGQIGHGYRLELETLDCGWLPLGRMRQVRERGRPFYESPALIGCALAIGRELYDALGGFDAHMRYWGVEDLDLGLRCWLLGHRILHDPQAAIGHRFRQRFDNYAVPPESFLANQLRMARKCFTETVWAE
jgi:GT2 family glycosyltransferase